MTIRINQVAVDFTLEKEKTFADLTASLRAWATAQNLAVLGLLADGKALGPDDATPLDHLSQIDVEAVPAGERDLARVAVIARFFSLLAQACERGDQALVAELHHEYGSVRSALFPLLAPLAARLEPALESLDGPWSDPAALAGAASKVAHEADAIRRELQAPVPALAETLETLDFSLLSLEALAGLFQKGLDRDGFELILHLFTCVEDLGRRVALVHRTTGSDPSGWVSFHSDLIPFLREAEAALASGDYILITDLLEYEIAPRLRSVRALFPEAANLDPVADLL